MNYLFRFFPFIILILLLEKTKQFYNIGMTKNNKIISLANKSYRMAMGLLVTELGKFDSLDPKPIRKEEIQFTPLNRKAVEDIVNQTLNDLNLFLVKMVWISDRLEIIVSSSFDVNNLEGPSIDVLNSVHSKIYASMELSEDLNKILVQCEVLVSSPGIGDVLKTDRDFVSFKGFPIIVTTKEEYKKKLEFTGTLVSRDDEVVSVSQKGKVTKIPRDIISEVRLPKAKYESFDEEIKKLQ